MPIRAAAMSRMISPSIWVSLSEFTGTFAARLAAAFDTAGRDGVVERDVAHVPADVVVLREPLGLGDTATHFGRLEFVHGGLSPIAFPPDSDLSQAWSIAATISEIVWLDKPQVNAHTMRMSKIFVNGTLPPRFRPIYELLQSGPKTRMEIAKALGKYSQTVTVHLSQMRSYGIVTTTPLVRDQANNGATERKGYVEYSLVKPVSFRSHDDMQAAFGARRYREILDALQACQKQFGQITATNLSRTLGVTRERGRQLLFGWAQRRIVRRVPMHFELVAETLDSGTKER